MYKLSEGFVVDLKFVTLRDVDALEKQYWACSHPLELYQLGDYYNLRLRVNNAIASPIIPLVNNHKLILFPFSFLKA